MGIRDLWSILTPFCERRPLYELQNKKVAIDLSCWVCEAQNITEYSVQPRMYLRNLYFRTCYLLLMGVIPVFVLEGKAPELKFDTIAARNLIQFKGAKPRDKEPEQNNNPNAVNDETAKKPAGKDRTRFHYTLKQCQDFLGLMGLACIKGNGEAESLCAYLNEDNLVDGIISQDSDCFAYGARVVYRNFCISQQGVKGGTADVFDMTKAYSSLNFGRNKIIALALLCGCDYGDGVHGIGKDSVLKLFQKVEDKDILDRLRSWRKEENLFEDLERKYENSNLCTSCGHSGKIQGHNRNGCKECRTTKGCDFTKFRDERLSIKNEINMRRKALQDPNFPDENLIREFLVRKDNVSELNLNWNQPDLVKFVVRCASWQADYKTKSNQSISDPKDARTYTKLQLYWMNGAWLQTLKKTQTVVTPEMVLIVLYSVKQIYSVKFTVKYLTWSEIYAFEKFLPILTRWQLLNHDLIVQGDLLKKSTKVILRPDRIKKARVIKGVPSYEIIWSDDSRHLENLIPQSQLDEHGDLEKLYSTIEPKHLVEKAHPKLEEQFLESKKKPAAIKKNSKRKQQQQKQKTKKDVEKNPELNDLSDLMQNVSICDEPVIKKTRKKPIANSRKNPRKKDGADIPISSTLDRFLLRNNTNPKSCSTPNNLNKNKISRGTIIQDVPDVIVNSTIDFDLMNQSNFGDEDDLNNVSEIVDNIVQKNPRLPAIVQENLQKYGKDSNTGCFPDNDICGEKVDADSSFFFPASFAENDLFERTFNDINNLESSTDDEDSQESGSSNSADLLDKIETNDEFDSSYVPLYDRLKKDKK